MVTVFLPCLYDPKDHSAFPTAGARLLWVTGTHASTSTKQIFDAVKSDFVSSFEEGAGTIRGRRLPIVKFNQYHSKMPSKLTLLFVDSDPAFITEMRRLLRGDFNVIGITDAVGALAGLEAKPETTIHILATSFQLDGAERPDGLDITVAFRKFHPQAPVLLIVERVLENPRALKLLSLPNTYLAEKAIEGAAMAMRLKKLTRLCAGSSNTSGRIQRAGSLGVLD